MVQFPIILLVIITGTPPSLKLLLLITSLFLNQLMTARGLPVTVQVKLTSSSDVTVVLDIGSVIFGETVEIHNKTLSINFSQFL